MGLFRKTKNRAGLIAISLQSDGIYVARATRYPTSKPQVEQVAFYSVESASVQTVLEKLAKDLHADQYHCATLLASGEYQLLSVDAPNVPAEELKTAIRWRLKDMLDFHVDDATIDVLDIPVDKNSPVRAHSMFAVAAKNQLIEARQAMFAQAKIPLSVIDIPELAQRNISVLLEPEGRGVAFLSFDGDGGMLTVTFNGELYLSRRIDITLQQLTQNDADQKNAYYERITLELQRSFDHFERQYQFVTLAKLILSSISDDDNGLQQYLAANLYMPVETFNLESVIDISKVPELQKPQAQQAYFKVLGAALRYEEKVL
ncbi:MSHA biogenesis protein MshI [Sulfurirhabdus autotrophica]|uniref:MSHA biogenesis protein MshI n=1 Tax=Sulfurirhabdus autotrophica TaxID=1706046 RepID=A0A4R3Y0Q9_9PROT|nr:MSHA biogenesis protein MshI [Sulfurirhabdus autotrophica]